MHFSFFPIPSSPQIPVPTTHPLCPRRLCVTPQSGFWHDALAEGHERDFDHLKMLAGEGNTNDGNEQQQAKKDVANGHPQTAKEDPEQVHGQGEAATVGTIADHALTKGPEHEHAQLEALQAEGNADDGKA